MMLRRALGIVRLRRLHSSRFLLPGASSSSSSSVAVASYNFYSPSSPSFFHHVSSFGMSHGSCIRGISSYSWRDDPEMKLRPSLARFQAFVELIKTWFRAYRSCNHQGCDYHEALSRRDAITAIEGRQQLVHAIPLYVILALPMASVLVPFVLIFAPRFAPRVLRTSELNKVLDMTDDLLLCAHYLEVMRSLNRLGVSSSLASEQFHSLHRLTLKAMSGERITNGDLLRADVLSCFPAMEQFVAASHKGHAAGTICCVQGRMHKDHRNHIKSLYEALPGFKSIPVYMQPSSVLRRDLAKYHDETVCDDWAIVREGGVEKLTEEEVTAACRRRGIRLPALTPAVERKRAALADWIEFTQTLLLNAREKMEPNSSQHDFPSRAVRKHVSALLPHAAAIKYYPATHLFKDRADTMLKDKLDVAELAGAFGSASSSPVSGSKQSLDASSSSSSQH